MKGAFGRRRGGAGRLPGRSVPLISPLSPSGEQCGGCRRSNTTDRPHSFQVILTDRPSLELSADNEEDMADWMQFFCQAVSKGVSGAQGLQPAPSFACSPFLGAAGGSGDVWRGRSRYFSPQPGTLPPGAPRGGGAPSCQVFTPPFPTPGR